ncbi:MAG TPA: glycoside hydrolase family 2 TIM barrel-domain containing protein [Terracidiphilus sp.]|nr:glycoside hydrolase family 2 TIM barrel-domain containing protein [Terracidiphilus sp.]
MQIRFRRSFHSLLTSQFAVLALAVIAPLTAAAESAPPPQVVLGSGWQLQDVAKAPQPGAEIASPGFSTAGWYAATVPGTVLTTLVNNRVYPEPLYGENNRPEVIPDSLARTSYWYRTLIKIPKSYKNHEVWLNFDGVNYSAVVWVNGVEVGTMRGAFIRGIFDITAVVKPGKAAVVAVLVTPQPHPGVPHEHTLRAGVGPNGGISAIDGPTFLSTLGWDWIPAIRDRDTGIWQKVFLSATGPVLVKDPLVTTDLPLPRTDSSDVAVEATLENVSDKTQKGVVQGTIESISFKKEVELAPHSTQTVRFDAKSTPALHMEHPRLWWPNGYGSPNMYKLRLSFKQGRKISDAEDVPFGVRKISYSVPGTDTLTISVNGVLVFIRGGDWGLDEAMKRIPRERLEAQIRMHKLANLNLIRNWVGQSTGEDFYELCDKYGIMVWDEFFQPNPGDGPNPDDIPTYMTNVRDKILRLRNHPSIVLWCARNEGDPPPEIDAALRALLAKLEPTRRYQPSSTDGGGVRSHGPYSWRAPREFYTITDDYFKTETGSVSVPTLESIQGMMPKKDWESINDDWAEHDFAKGNSGADKYPAEIAARYGAFRNLADFVRKAQLANYEAFRAMYEGRNAKLFHPTTAVITWMSNPAQPSFVWQIYHYDFEPMSSFFAVQKAGEMVHIQYNQANGELQVINNFPTPVRDAVAHVAIYNLDGTLAYEHETKVNAEPDVATNLGAIEFPATVSPVHFIKLDLLDSKGKLLSSNFYWRSLPEHPDDFGDLNKMARVTLDAKAASNDSGGERTVTVTLHNPSQHIALMAHLQLRRQKSGERVLPAFYSDNYVSLVPNETRTITIDAAVSNFNGEDALVVFDGWNVMVAEAKFKGVSVASNLDADPMHSPATWLPYQTIGLR